MKTQPIHYQTHPLAAHCGATLMDPDVPVLIGHTDPAEVTCPQCISSPDLAELVHATRRTLKGLIEPLDDWAERERAESERRFRISLALDSLYRETPWWAVGTRHLVRQALAKVNA